ncbi:MAG: NADH-quinone oxidoreductase subunit L, partial [Bacteroidota bacterium]|nr:NADH-quinone oxidoreductase subunit L [Bacteroidota bacterium]
MQIPLAALLLMPLFGFLINFIFGKRLPKTIVGIVGCGTVLVSFAVSLYFFSRIIGGEMESSGVSFFNWFHVGDFTVSFSFLVDRLSVLMLLIITGIGFLIHVYSTGYMQDDEGFHRFFAYLNLFIFFMQILVLGANYPVMFIGWEGVGLCSYLLIGFWYRNQEYNDAANKAFIMNRIGDLGLLLGIFLLWQWVGSVDYSEVFNNAGNLTGTQLTTLTILFFIGATGKSAQLPLYTWLPDAMAGPTPVSALIHAATMVTAGIYLIVRSHILFALAPYTLDIILGIGIATALFA